MNICSVHPSKKFNYDHDTNAFTAWASDLGPHMFDRIYDDACDIGLSIVSHKTGAVSTFYVDKEERNDGDIMAWHLKPTEGTVRRHPLLKDTTVIVFNT